MKYVKYFKAVVSIVILVAFDQLTKWLAVKYLLPSGPISIIDGVFELRYLENRGAAFGIFQNRQWMFILLTLIIVAAVIWLYIKMPETKRMLPLRIISVAVISGAIGNLIDRILNSYVVDFLYFRLIDFPIFNVADIYVTVSAVIFIILFIFYYKDDDFKFLNRKEKAAHE